MENCLAFVGMVVAILAQASNMVVTKVAMSEGTNKFIMAVYSNAISAFILLPSAFFFHRCSGQIFGYVGIEYSSPTLGTAMLNLIPAFTFILASSHLQSEWILGGLFLASDCFVSSLWYILQASTQKKYPAVLLAVLYQTSFSALMAAVFSFIAVKDTNAWKLKFDMGLVAVLYTAIVSTVIRYSLITWCVWKAGALYCSMFKPLGIIFTVFMGAIFLGESLYLGSLIGAIIIVSGFYAVLWGKAKEDKMEKDGGVVDSTESFDHKVPLLQNKQPQKQNLPM
ncbi:WAT1-related protein [Trema orientale]|uniref:WAT1-related protein n=1 Tax=Trema orientale TaxID=63057 RepID=A0A2P5FMA0_TREOI|nr:WAT1-related protein [Trema orientale]